MTARRSAAALAAVTALAFPALLSAARGDLDPTFGSGGKVTTDFGGHEEAWGLAVQPDGKAVVAGERRDGGAADDFVLARYTVRGALDATFDGDGKVTTEFGGFDGADDVAIQADGKIVAAGSAFLPTVRRVDFALARYNRDGSLDATFGDRGRVLTTFAPDSTDGAHAVLIQRDGKIVAAGSTGSGLTSDFAVARYLPNGALDRTFDGDGLVATPIPGGAVFDLALQPDGRLIAAGWSRAGSGFDIAIARYNPDGSLDSSLDGDGVVVASSFRPASTYASQVLVQRDGKILTGGAGLARFNPDGSVDRSFGVGGRAVTDLVLVTPLLQPDGKILAAGGTNVRAVGDARDFAVGRLTAAGRIDPTFGRGGRVVTNFSAHDDATDAQLLANGKLVVSGHSSHIPLQGPADFAVARYVAIRFCVVPGVRGKALAVARASLTKALCKVGSVKRRYSASVGKGRVISQRPAPRTRMAERAKVDLVVSRGRRASRPPRARR